MKFTFTKYIRIPSRNQFLVFSFLFLAVILFAASYPGHFWSFTRTETAPPDSITKSSSAFDSLYKSILANAQGLYASKKYEQALAEFEKAQRMKPDDKSLKEPVDKLKILVVQQKAMMQEYQKLVVSGDGYFKAKDYFNAKSSYQQAIELNPDDPVAKDKLKQTMDLLRSQKAQNILYDVAIASAEKMFQAKEYDKAKAEFEKASRILPEDKFAKDRINDIIKLMVDKQANEERYAKSIAAADKYYNGKLYPSALLEYQKASTCKPEEEYPKTRITELTALIKAQKATDEAYKKAIAAADLLFQNAGYPEAKKEYQNAVTIKPEEIYPQNRIKQIDQILAEKMKVDREFDRLVSVGDSLYIEKKFIGAKANYQQALKIKPAESYPKEMISKIDNQVASQEANQKAMNEAYLAAIAAADKLLAEKSYERAKTEYKNASSIKPSEQYPKDKILEIEGVLAALDKMKSLDDQYNTLIAGAEKLLADKSYEASRTEFEKASAVKPAEIYPKDKIAEITRIISELSQQKSKDEQYARTIAIADKFFADKVYEQSKSQYQLALQLKPDEQYPKDRITELNKILAGIAAAKALDDQYQATVDNADKLLTAHSYNEAKAEYLKALTLKPAEEYPQKRIVEIDNYFAGLAESRAREESYKSSIAKADKLFTEKSYEQARSEYQNARTIKPDEVYPKTRIAEIDQLLADLARQKSLEEQYTALISQGDQQFTEKNYTEAKSKYQAALAIKPDQQYPKDKLSEIDGIIAGLAKLKALDDQYKSVIAKADQLLAATSLIPAKTEYSIASGLKPDESYPKEKIAEIDALLADAAALKALDEKYQSTIKNADLLLAAKSYDQARTEYSSASSIKPLEQYPKDKISEIDKILAGIAEARSKDEQYKATIDKGDQLLAAKEYEPAKTEYKNALIIKPGEVYPATKISEIDKILAEIARQKNLDEQYATFIATGDKQLAAKSYAEAKLQYQSALQLKPEQTYPKGKIAEIDQLLTELAKLKSIEEQYQALIAKADNLFQANSLEQAKVEYTSAGILKPAETYPKEKISEIDKLLADAAQLKATNLKYQGLIDDADKLFAAKNYEQAKAGYSSASLVKPGELYPKEKINEIDKILAAIAEAKARDEQYNAGILKADKLLLSKSYADARTEYQNAGAIKPEETYPKVKIGEIDKILEDISRQKALNDEYARLVSDADKLFQDKTYTEAKTQYQSASALKPLEQYPKDQILLIDKALADLVRLKAIDDQYNASISKAEQLLADKSYDLARAEFLAASRIKPLEKYPNEKVVEIDKIVAAINKQKAIDEQYKASVAKADKLLADRSYDLAKNEYIEAGTIKPQEQYPKDKIAEIESLLSELKLKDAAYKAAITKADQLLLQKSYEEARNEYQNASGIKPSEQYPKTKIADINNILMTLKGKKQTYDDLVKNADDQFSQKEYYKSKEFFQQASGIFPEEAYPRQRLARINSMIDSIYRANKGLYDKAVADGDKYFNSLIYDKAIDAYTEATGFLPMEKYPKEMISKIKKAIAENALVDVLKTTLVVTSGEEKQLPFEPTNPASRKNNYLYIKIKNLSTKPINVLVRYGKDKTTSGGAVIRNLVADGNTYDRLISVRDQDPWYRIDNNWIGLLPQGGDIEVTFIQISRAAQ